MLLYLPQEMQLILVISLVQEKKLQHVHPLLEDVLQGEMALQT